MSIKKIGMVVAIERELRAVLKKYEGLVEVKKAGGFNVFSVELDDRILYVTHHGAGEIRAAAAVQMLISEYHVDMIVNHGVVGALVDRLKSAHTCVVEKVVHYDFDTSASDGCEVGRYIEYDDLYIHTTPEYVKMACSYDESIIPVTCASGDKFIADESKKRELAEQFGAEICDMESAGVALVCYMNNVPNLLIKTVADSIEGGAEECQETVVEAAEICFDLVDKIVREI